MKIIVPSWRGVDVVIKKAIAMHRNFHCCHHLDRLDYPAVKTTSVSDGMNVCLLLQTIVTVYVLVSLASLTQKLDIINLGRGEEKMLI